MYRIQTHINGYSSYWNKNYWTHNKRFATKFHVESEAECVREQILEDEGENGIPITIESFSGKQK